MVLMVFIGGSPLSQGQEIPIRQETLGQWHYLHDLEVRTFNNTQGPPVAVMFGAKKDRMAVLLPGSYLLAEFKTGHFFDLHLSTELMPSSLGCDPKNGRLFCLAQRKDVTMTTWTERWMTSLDSRGWSRPERTPINPCDRLVFDKQDRLWALGPSRSVACLDHGKWNRYSYNDDTKLHYAPIRLASNPAGDPVLFADWEPPRDQEISHLLGTLTYRNGNFVHDAGAETTGLIQEEVSREAADSAVTSDSSAGYLIQKNVGWMRARTRIDFGGYTIVSMGADGLAWTSQADAGAKPLSIDDEWQAVDDVLCPPTSDWPRGIMWVVRNAPSRFVKITAEKTEEFPITTEPKFGGENITIDADTRGNPWLMSWHGAERGPVIVLEGDQAKSYPDLGAALLAEGGFFSAGRIFPFAIKAPSGLIAFGGGYFDALTVIEGGKVMGFDAAGIDPAEPQKVPDSGHGFNPFRGGEPWVDRKGLLHTAVIGNGFVYENGKWSPSAASEAKEGAVPPLPEEEGPVVDPDGSRVEPYAYSRTVFRGFHFYRDEAEGEKQLDSGLNPLATYPFGNSYVIPAVLDPQGRIWVNNKGRSFPQPDATWYIERK
jgi:hypothetical protein